MSIPIAVPGKAVPLGSWVSPGGIRGVATQGGNAFTNTIGNFTIPPIGGTVEVEVEEGQWIIPGQYVYIGQAGGPGIPGAMQVVARDGNELTLWNPPIPGPVIVPSVPTGTIMDFGGSVAPEFFLMCDGAQYEISDFPELFAVIAYTFGGAGSVFNVPDCRSRTVVGAGQGAGLTNRAFASRGGSETHALSQAELAPHSHTGSVANHTHTVPAHGHSFSPTPHGHGFSPSPHSHRLVQDSSWYYQTLNENGAVMINYLGTGIGATNTNAVNADGTVQNASANGTVNNAAAFNTTATQPVVTLNNSGGGVAHPNMQPWLALSKIIKT